MNNDINRTAKIFADKLIDNSKKVARGIARGTKNISKRALKKGFSSTSVFVMKLKLYAMIFFVIAILVLIVVGVVVTTSSESKQTKGQNKNYINGGNTVSEDSISLSPANAAAYNFYRLMSDKSYYQYNVDGSGKLVRADSPDYITDYYNREKLLKLNYNFLYCLDYYGIGNEIVYPEQFIQPVAFNKEDMSLKNLVDENNDVVVKSNADLTGKTDDLTMKSVMDYGFGTVATYKQAEKKLTYHLVSTKEDYYDETTGEIKVRYYEEPIVNDIEASAESIYLLDEAVTFGGDIKFCYKNNESKKGIVNGITSDPNQPYDKILIGNYFYAYGFATKPVFEKIEYEDGYLTLEQLDEYLENNEGINKNSLYYSTRTRIFKDDGTRLSISETDIFEIKNYFVPSEEIDESSEFYGYDSFEDLTTYLSDNDGYVYKRTLDSKAGEKEYLAANGYTGFTLLYAYDKPLYQYRDTYESGIIESVPVEDPLTPYIINDIGYKYMYEYLENLEIKISDERNRTYSMIKDINSASASVYQYDTVSNSGSASGSALAYIELIAPMAQKEMREAGLLASVTMAQCILEGGFPGHSNSNLASEYNNCFGLTAGADWNGPVINLTSTVDAGTPNEYTETHNFCVFESLEDCFEYRSKFLWNVRTADGYRYRDCVGVTDYREAITLIINGGYCSNDHDYIGKICRIIESYNLTQYDTEEWNGVQPEYATSLSSNNSENNRINVYSTGLSDEDKEIFRNFYEFYEENTSWKKKSIILTDSKIKDIIIYTDNFNNDSRYDEAKDYLSDIKVFDNNFIGISYVDEMSESQYISLEEIGAIVGNIEIAKPILADTIRVTSLYNMHRDDPVYTGQVNAHHGTDISVSIGTNLYSMTSGNVIAAGYGGEAGYYITISSNEADVTFVYKHLNDYSVSVGDYVEAGQLIGHTGNTGKSTGAHLHLELRSQGNSCNNIEILKAIYENVEIAN